MVKVANYENIQANAQNPAEGIKTLNKLQSDESSDFLSDIGLYSIHNVNYEAWDSFKISRNPISELIPGIQMPGVSKIKISFSNDIKNTHTPNYDYSHVMHRGANSKIINITTQMAPADYRKYLYDVLPMLHVNSFDKNKSIVVYIENTLLKINNISSVMLLSIEQSTPEAALFKIDMQFVESKRPLQRKYNPKLDASIGTLSPPPNASNPGAKA